MGQSDSNAAQQLSILEEFPDTIGKIKARPFVKWAGGKSQLLPELTKRLPRNYKRYWEPFIGGGALFFHVSPKEALISDTNTDLIDTYKVVRDDVGSLIEELSEYSYEEGYYYSVRNWDRKPDYPLMSAVKRAARFIYLNKTCFNGLFRVNSKGHFNVPFGKYTNPTILDVTNLRRCSAALQGAEIVKGHYASVLEGVKRGDFVYFDPPYAPLSTTSSFTAYTAEGFRGADQEALRELCHRIDKVGAMFMLSNSRAPETEALYKDFNVEVVAASRAINSKAEKRGPIEEIIVTNY